MGMGTSGDLYSGFGQTGSDLIIAIAAGDRYYHESGSMLQHDGFLWQINSGTLNPSPTQDMSLILFPDEFFSNGDGGYQMVTVPSGNGPATNFDVQMNWYIGSFLIVASAPAGKEHRVSYKALFMEQWKQSITAELKGKASIGEPQLSWDIFDENPPSPGAISPSSAYLTVTQWMQIHVDAPFTDYNAALEYWIYLYPSGNGLAASVPMYWWYLDGGALHDCIQKEFVPVVQQGAVDLQNQLNQTLSAIQIPSGIHDVYYLPGNQTTPHYGWSWGGTDDDITIVIVSN